MEAATTSAKPGRPKGSKNRGATPKKSYKILPAENFKALGEVDAINPKDALKEAFDKEMIKTEDNVIVIPSRFINEHKVLAKRKVVLTVE